MLLLPGWGQDSGTGSTAAAGTAFMAAKQGEARGLAVQNALGLDGLQTGKPARRGPLHLSSARDQLCPPAQKRWVTLAAHTQHQAHPPAATAAPAARSLLCSASLGWHKSGPKGLWLCHIQSKGTSAGAAHRAVVWPLAGLCSLGSGRVENQLAQIQQMGVISF